MKVLKFGGTSVGSAKNINNVIDILNSLTENDKVLCVVSAVGGITDKLLAAGNLAKNKDAGYLGMIANIKEIHFKIVKELNPNHGSSIANTIDGKFKDLENLLNGIYLINELSPKTSDKLTSYGEMLSSFIIAETMKNRGISTELKNAQELIITNSNFTKAEVDYTITNKNIQNYFKTVQQSITILPGFIAHSKTGENTTLGRGGSDFTAAILAAALRVEQLEIWTDVSGMFTSNPKLVKQAYPIEKLSYQEAMELSHFGAKVLYPPTVQPVLDLNIPIHIKNTLEPKSIGTIISNDHINSGIPVKGISNINNIALLTLQGSGMIGIPGFSKRLFETLSQEKINVILITQASSEHSICIGIDVNDSDVAKTAIDKTFENEIALNKIDPIIVETNLSIIALIGDNMKNHQGISGKMFSTLGKNNINIRAIAQGASEKNISAVILQSDVKKALNSLHEQFFEVKTKQLNVFITGVGNVGEKLLEQIKQQKKYLKETLKISLHVVGLSNSRTMIFDTDGIDLNTWKEQLKEGEKASLHVFFETVKTLNLRNSIFVDVTANDEVANLYANYLRQSIGVVACNKIACSNPYDHYSLLKRLSLKYNAPFLFETNVGAGLPIIDTLNNLIASGDKITSIQAVLSGSLNFVFNNFNDSTKFYDVVKQAAAEGYTEPDPRIDLSGVDVARKILILARESGLKMNLEDISNTSFLSDSGVKSNTVDDFYQTLIKDEAHYQGLYASAKAKNCQLKYVAELNQGKAQVGLKEIPEGHPFFNLKGKDNIVMFYTQRYPEQPMIIKGAGAGADVTASGLFADIIRIGNY
ncbi:MAG: bifunctional aspartate kinase/homoserine dehydrogenase I [Flavobacteriales bacterium]|nr:bifunctional aspartate kinase/homoserine dehydrogenase I [Flavobacteriia bacterium]NCP06397.1 bifunctional aspartate kinase/homoserine dehydrogenase I [Flavobacteriales bacterium]PIV94913.1 MAG: bifunctional aspartate kinase/homoserine dehydrogenase I [Flavobacteriaceae bacterium CG17_big_fil_post_rev_8_21_14_2_50_33_15]PIY09545.1 MAG: bifunctional aspartate kinase/homoserine dehydrogenase I [Flavobacteriaceae bacterium CG_4_10_14_3_um_filter_33_47]PJB17496.1 MAG: bifunctional aspartate kina